jgi:pyruvate dehydrogenase E2 component (dihydrolipoamide acetyltransferase)
MSASGVIKVVMPQMGESLAEGTVVRWLKTLGDTVARDESLFEISTDKVDTDVPAPAAGILEAILVQEGQTVAVGEPVALLKTRDGSGAEMPSSHVTPPAAALAAPPSEPQKDEKPQAPSGGHFTSSHAPQLVSFRRSAAPAASRSASEQSFSPAVLETARRGGVDLHALTRIGGSGRGGRITKADVERFLQTRANTAPAAATQGPSRMNPAITAEVPAEYLHRPGPEDRPTPMSTVRRKIAHHMTWSVRISPHATAETEVDMDAAAKRVKNARAAQDQNAPLTYTVVVAVAAVQALRDFPTLNSSVVGDELILKPSINLGIAVALPDSEELIVPVVRRAEELSEAGMAGAIHDLATRARTRKLRPEDVQGGTFTLTNPGMYGGLRGTPIINQPQVAILGLGAVTRRTTVIGDAIAIRPMMNATLTFDHRAADGMVAFRYLARLRELLEQTGQDKTRIDR